jgi:hypothetical protein
MTKEKLAVISLIMLPISLILNGITLSTIWTWFMVTTFDMPMLTIAQALGVVLVANYFTFWIPKYKWEENDEEKAVRLVAFPFIKMGMFLSIGWVIHLFI